MAYTSRSFRSAALFVSLAAALVLLSACGNGTDAQDGPEKVAGTAAPATLDETGGDESASPRAAATEDTSRSSDPSDDADAESSGGGVRTAAAGARCHTSELGASVGRNRPGAGQENFPIVLTNNSGRTCTVRGFPGAAFVNASGGQLGSDPRRSSESSVTVTLKPGQSAWAGLSFSNPQVSGARTAAPDALLVTPPNERDSLKVTWTAGTVPVSGNYSSASLTVLKPGTGA
jgi:hypothetical protein